jgi:hypothetical protein
MRRLSMVNENALKGFKCPECGHTEKFIIAVSALAIVTDTEATEVEYYEFGDDSYCECPHCEHSGSVHDFRKEE